MWYGEYTPLLNIKQDTLWILGVQYAVWFVGFVVFANMVSGHNAAAT